jgi:hypothetical protein
VKGKAGKTFAEGVEYPDIKIHLLLVEEKAANEVFR